MEPNLALPLLAGLTPAQFMRRHWQKKPLLVRAAVPGFKPVVDRAELFRLAAREEVESRLIVQNQTGWRMKHGPFAARSLPALKQAAWTLLVQGVDLHHAGAHALLQQFRFLPDARLDDLMISFATPGGGVGPHFDSYDVFLFQASGRRRWKIGRQKDLALQPDVPLKILQNFVPEQEFVLEAGDMLYLPPRYAHEGIAEAATGADGKPEDCLTYSIGFRAPVKQALAAELLHRLAEFCEDEEDGPASETPPAQLYRDPDQPATEHPAAVPAGLASFATDALLQALQDPLAVACALGEYLTEPKASVWFEAVGHPVGLAAGICLAPQTRMMYDAHHVFINGESYRAKGADARLMHLLADERALSAKAISKASPSAVHLLLDWAGAGWIQAAAASSAP